MTQPPQVRDRTRINLSEILEVRYWCKELKVSEQQLREAVIEGGSSEVCRVRDFLRSRP